MPESMLTPLQLVGDKGEELEGGPEASALFVDELDLEDGLARGVEAEGVEGGAEQGGGGQAGHADTLVLETAYSELVVVGAAVGPAQVGEEGVAFSLEPDDGAGHSEGGGVEVELAGGDGEEELVGVKQVLAPGGQCARG